MTKTETFRNVIFSDKKYFDVSADRVSLKRYSENLMFYTSFDSTTNAVVHSGSALPIETGFIELENFGTFSQHVNVNGSIEYDKNNFTNLKNEGSVHFRLRTGFNNASSYQHTKGNLPAINVVGVYHFDLFINNNFVKHCKITITAGSTISTILAEIALPQNLGDTQARCLNTLVNKLNFYGNVSGLLVEVKNPSSIPEGEFSLIDYFGGIEKPTLPNGPLVDSSIFTFSNKIDNRNKIEFVHTAGSHLKAIFYDKDGVLLKEKDFGIFSNSFMEFYAIELAWNENAIMVFVNGKMLGIEHVEMNRDNVDTFFILGTTGTDYKIDEVIIYNDFYHFKNYIPATKPLTPYTTIRPYVDVEFGLGFDEEEVKGLNLRCSNNCHFTVKLGDTWYYYFAGDWRRGDGSFNQTNTPGELETKFEDLYFNKDATLIVRTYLDSDGYQEAWIDEISIVLSSGDLKSAVITGTISLTNTVDVSVDKYITITTDKGEMEVDVSLLANDPTQATLEEIIQAINSYNVLGLLPVKDDGYGHLVLSTITKGKEAYISISDGENESALEIVWGYETTDIGAEGSATTTIDYTPLFDFVRNNLGAPIVPVELTDGQLETALQEAIEEYNRHRNYDENFYYMSLAGDPNEGYEIPAIIGGRQSIVDVVFRPKMGFANIATSDDIFAQALAMKYGNNISKGFMADYHLYLSLEKDMGIILGTTPTWEILNGRLFITPKPYNNMTVAIKYKAPLSIGELLNDFQIKRYVLAKSKIILGTIRSTFGSSIPGGGENIQLNGAELISQGREDLAAVKTEMKGLQEPLMMIVG